MQYSLLNVIFKKAFYYDWIGVILKIPWSVCYLCNKTVYVYWLLLADAVNSKHGLSVIGRVPGGIEDDDSVRCNQVGT